LRREEVDRQSDGGLVVVIERAMDLSKTCKKSKKKTMGGVRENTKPWGRKTYPKEVDRQSDGELVVVIERARHHTSPERWNIRRHVGGKLKIKRA
jgi:nitrate reductase NapAB chaperone NapD